MLNRIIIEDLNVQDQDQQDLLKVARLSARFDIWELLKGKISINSVQLFGFDLKLNKQSADDRLNMQFIIDAFSKPQSDEPTRINLRVNSLLVRRGKLSYDVLDAPTTQGKFNTSHLQFNNIIANISLKALQNDSINASIKRLSVTESSGIELKKLSLKVVGNRDQMQLQNFEVNLPQSKLEIDTMNLRYAGVTSFDEFADQVEFSLQTLPSHISLGDLSAFVPGFKNFKERVDFGLALKGTINQLSFTNINVNADEHLYIQGNANIDGLSNPKEAYLFTKLSRLSIDQEGMAFLIRNFSSEFTGVPPILERLETIAFNGELSGYFNDFVTYGILRSKAGTVRTDIKFSSDQDKGLNYSGRLRAEKFDLDVLTGNPDFGDIDFNFDVVGQRNQNQNFPNVKLLGKISNFDFRGYNYDEMTIDGLYKNGGFDGQFLLDDENALVSLLGSFNFTKTIPEFNFKASVDRFRPYPLHISKRDEDAIFSVDVVADFTGNSIDLLNGEININNLLYNTSDLSYSLDNFKIKAEHTDQENNLIIDSNFLKAKINGQYSYQTLWGSIYNISKTYLPSLTSSLKEPKKSKNNFNFEVELIDTKILTHFLNIPFQTYTSSQLSGYFNDEHQKVHIKGYFPKLRYGNTFYESAMLLFENPGDELIAQIRFTQQKKHGAVNVALLAEAKNDKIDVSLNWGNDGVNTYSGKFNALTHFEVLKNEKRKRYLQTDIEIKPSNIILNDTTWRVHPSSVHIGDQLVEVNNFLFSNDLQFAQINGKISASPQDTLALELNDIDLGYIFDLTGISSDVDFKGKATGYAIASQLFSEPQMQANLHVNDFTFNNGPLGDMGIYSFWDNKQKGIFLDADMNENDLGLTNVTGFIYPIAPKGGLDLKITGKGTNVKFLEEYMKGIATDVNGRAYGSVRLHGPFKALNLEGSLLTDASLRIGILNTSFAINDTLRFTKNGMSFKDIQLTDPESQSGKLNGELYYQHFKKLSYHFDINAYNLLVMNTQESADMPFFGKIHASGNTTISGNQAGLNVNAAVRTDKNTQFTFITNATASAASNQFIHFNDVTPHRHYQDTIFMGLEEHMLSQNEKDAIDSNIDIRLNLQIDATPNANIKIIIDPVAGDYMSANGNGNIRLDYYNKGDVRLFGNYEITKGLYKFSLQEVIRKDFTIKQGSNITFNGNPREAVLDIRTQYTVNSVSLNDLIPQESLITSQPHIKVNCLMNLSGQLTNSNITFNLDLPSESDEVRTLVKNYISTEEQMNMQVLYLLGIGEFYTTDNGNQSSDMMSSVLSSTLSGQLNNLLSQMINNNNWSIGTNVSTGNKGWTDVEVEGMLSAQLLNNRLLINGNLGYRENPLTNSNFIGDFEAELLLNSTGNIRLRAYSKTNDRYLSRINLTTQGIGIMFRRDFIYWKELLFWNNIKLRRKARLEAQKRARTFSEETTEQEGN